ncbi:MAG: DUF3575 domain-containing protein [Rikenellaceae bacterium]
MKHIYTLILLLMPLLAVSQEVSIKTNALYWTVGTINLGTEIGLGKRVSFDLLATYNPFEFKEDLKIKHWSVNPDFRFWLCEKFSGHFFGLGAIYAQYNMAGIPFPGYSWAKDSRYQGWAVAASLTYGYQWAISKRWNMEAVVGVGYVYAVYDKYKKGKCGDFLDNDKEHLILPTKLALTFIYIIK